MKVSQGLARLLIAAALIAAGTAVARAQTDQQPGGIAPSQPGETPLGGPVILNPAPPGPGVPRGDILEVMVKGALMTFNDANLSGNYAVLNARLHPIFREQVPAERLATIFAVFRTNKINIGPALVHKPVYTEGPSIDPKGLLAVKGHLETRPWRTVFDLAWRRQGEEWWLWKLNVRVRPPEQ